MADDPNTESLLESGRRRRQFLQQIGLVAGALLLPPAGWTQSLAIINLAQYAPQALRADEFAAVARLMSRLIPADGLAPGAVEAGAHCYLDRALNTYYAGDLPIYRAALAALSVLVKQAGSASIEACPAADLDGVIAQLEAGSVASQTSDPQIAAAFPDGGGVFFHKLRQHTVEGLLCDPMYGGNQNFAGWRLIGFPGVQFVYSAADQSINSHIQSANHSIADFGAAP